LGNKKMKTDIRVLRDLNIGVNSEIYTSLKCRISLDTFFCIVNI
jgi:hypothetical protein